MLYLILFLITTFISTKEEVDMSDITPAYLYKIVSPEYWEKSKDQENLLLAEVDKEFIHFSTNDQLDRILQKYWGDRPYILLKVETAQLPGDMRFETNPGGVAKYYHLYNGAIPLKATTIVTLQEVI